MIKRLILVALLSASAFGQLSSTIAILPSSVDRDGPHQITACDAFGNCTAPVLQPRKFSDTVMNTTFPTQTGATHTVAGGDFTGLQNWLNNSTSCGDTIKLVAYGGNPANIYTGSLVLPDIPAGGSGWILIKSANISSLPAYGNRIFLTAPDDTTRSNMARLTMNNAASNQKLISLAFGNHCGYWLAGIEGYPSGTSFFAGANANGVPLGSVTDNLVSIQGNHFVTDRSYWHAYTAVAFPVTGCYTNGSTVTVISDNWAQVGDTEQITGLTGSCAALNGTTPTVTGVGSFTNVQLATATNGFGSLHNIWQWTLTGGVNPFADGQRIIIEPNITSNVGMACIAPACQSAYTGDRTVSPTATIIPAGCSITASSTTLTCPTAAFTALNTLATVGMSIYMPHAGSAVAGSSSGPLVTTIAVVTNATTLTLTAAAGSTVTNSPFWYGTPTATGTTFQAINGGLGVCNSGCTPVSFTNLYARTLAPTFQFSSSVSLPGCTSGSPCSDSGFANDPQSPQLDGAYAQRQSMTRAFNISGCDFCGFVGNWVDQVISGAGVDNQAIFSGAITTGAGTNGPVKVYNNMFATGGENVELGGALGCTGTGCTQQTATVGPHDWEVQDGVWNCPEELFWMSATFNPRVWALYGDFKTNFETKTISRILIAGNVMHGCWSDGGPGDYGNNYRLEFRPNQSGNTGGTNANDLTIVNNWHDGAHFPFGPSVGSCNYDNVQPTNQLNTACLPILSDGTTMLVGHRWTIQNNGIQFRQLFSAADPGAWPNSTTTSYGNIGLSIGNNIQDFSVLHNTFYTSGDYYTVPINGGFWFISPVGHTVFNFADVTTPPNGPVCRGTNWSVNDIFEVPALGTGCVNVRQQVTAIGAGGCVLNASARTPAPFLTGDILSCNLGLSQNIVVDTACLGSAGNYSACSCAISSGGCTPFAINVYHDVTASNHWYNDNVFQELNNLGAGGQLGQAALNISLTAPLSFAGNMVNVTPNTGHDTSTSPYTITDCTSLNTNDSNCQTAGTLVSNVGSPSAAVTPVRAQPDTYFKQVPYMRVGFDFGNLELVTPYARLNSNDPSFGGGPVCSSANRQNCTGADFTSPFGLIQATVIARTGSTSGSTTYYYPWHN